MNEELNELMNQENDINEISTVENDESKMSAGAGVVLGSLLTIATIAGVKKIRKIMKAKKDKVTIIDAKEGDIKVASCDVDEDDESDQEEDAE